MKIMSFALLLMASMAFVLAGCLDNSIPVATPDGQATSGTSTMLGKSGPWLNAVSGNIHVFMGVTNGNSGKHWTMFSNMSLSAMLDQNSMTSGTIQSRYIGTPLPGNFPPFSGKMIQLIVEDDPEVGRMAKVMFEITRGAELFPPEYGPKPVGCFVVVDGGEGKSALPDCISSLVAIDSPEIMQLYGFYGMTPSDYIEAIIPVLPFFGLDSPYQPVGNGNIQVR